MLATAATGLLIGQSVNVRYRCVFHEHPNLSCASLLAKLGVSAHRVQWQACCGCRVFVNRHCMVAVCNAVGVCYCQQWAHSVRCFIWCFCSSSRPSNVVSMTVFESVDSTRLPLVCGCLGHRCLVLRATALPLTRCTSRLSALSVGTINWHSFGTSTLIR